jgi:hypothetical protein
VRGYVRARSARPEHRRVVRTTSMFRRRLVSCADPFDVAPTTTCLAGAPVQVSRRPGRMHPLPGPGPGGRRSNRRGKLSVCLFWHLVSLLLGCQRSRAPRRRTSSDTSGCRTHRSRSSAIGNRDLERKTCCEGGCVVASYCQSPGRRPRAHAWGPRNVEGPPGAPWRPSRMSDRLSPTANRASTDIASATEMPIYSL